MPGNNADWGVPERSITLPPDAGPTDPRIVIGPDIAPPLTTIPNVTVFGNILLYFNATEFWFLAVGSWTSVPTKIALIGTYDTVNGITVYFVFRPDFNEMAIGSNAFDANVPDINFRDVHARFESTTLEYTGLAGLEITDAGTSVGRGLAWYNASTGVSNSTGIGNWVLILADPTFGGFFYSAGRAYRIEWRAYLFRGAAGDCFFSLRNTAGSVLIYDHGAKPARAGGVNYDTTSSIVLVNNTAAGIQKTIGWYLNDAVGTAVGGIAGAGQCEIWCRDIGAAADYPNAFSV